VISVVAISIRRCNVIIMEGYDVGLLKTFASKLELFLLLPNDYRGFRFAYIVLFRCFQFGSLVGFLEFGACLVFGISRQPYVGNPRGRLVVTRWSSTTPYGASNRYFQRYTTSHPDVCLL
jgi:hypothetical protein